MIKVSIISRTCNLFLCIIQFGAAILFLKKYEIPYLRYCVVVRSRSDVIVTILSPMEYFSQAPECQFELQIGCLAAVSSPECLVTQGKLIS